MSKIQIVNVSKKYVTNKTEIFYAVRNISLTFEDTGFVAIEGKSGSGKSTILNLIGRLDSPSEGEVIFDGRNINKFKKKDKIKYYKCSIGILFQSYNLIDSETVLFNVALPSLIRGIKKADSYLRARQMLKYVELPEDLYEKKVSLLSGGEKQRVALARCLMNEPDVVLCDEPTGALDSGNSNNVMDILKKYSKDKLVIMVSHNPQLVNSYCDRIIEIIDGRIESDKIINEIEGSAKKSNKIAKTSTSWINELSISNFKRRFKRNLFSLFALSISLVSTFIAIGFSLGKDESVKLACLKQFDYYSGTISKQEEVSKGKLISLTRSVRPAYKDLITNKNITQNFDICLNFDAIMPSKPSIEYDELNIDDILLTPIYSFDSTHSNASLLTKGKMPTNDLLDEVLINDRAFTNLKAKLNKDPIGETLHIYNRQELTFVDYDNTYITDSFEFDKLVKITGVVSEMDYLKEPKIFYSYSAFEEYTKIYVLTNLSTYFNREVTWFDRITDADNFDAITAFSYRLFPKTHSLDIELTEKELNGLSFTSSSLLIRDSLMNFMEVARYGILLFLGITILGTMLIMGIMSFTSYSEDHKISAILTCIGASNDEISNIYLNESLLIGLLSILFSMLVSYGLSFGINALIEHLVGLQNIVAIPFASFLGIPVLFPLISIVASLIFTSLVTLVPIAFSKRISLKEELQTL